MDGVGGVDERVLEIEGLVGELHVEVPRHALRLHIALLRVATRIYTVCEYTQNSRLRLRLRNLVCSSLYSEFQSIAPCVRDRLVHIIPGCGVISSQFIYALEEELAGK